MANADYSVTSVKIDKQQTAFITKEGSQAMGIECGSVDFIGNLMASQGCEGCQMIFDTYGAPNFKRCFNAAVKRINRIAAVAGVSVSEPVEYFINGYRQTDKWVMVVKN